MIGRVALLILGCVAAWAALVYPAWLKGGDEAVVQSAVAMGICLVPAAITLAWGRRVLQRAPEQVFLLLVGGLALRMFLVFAAGILLSAVIPAVGHRAFWLWVVLFYVWTLALEMVLLLWGHAAAGTSGQRV